MEKFPFVGKLEHPEDCARTADKYERTSRKKM
jgi:hypothetical protein